MGPFSQKILLLLLGGAALGLTPYPNKQFKIIKEITKEWGNINRNNLNKSIKRLYESKLVKMRNNKDGTSTLVLTLNGKRKALTYNAQNIKIRPMEKWDGKWRIVLFDIPEKSRKARDAIRHILKKSGFFEYQKSIFVHPFNCQDEISFVVEFFNMRQHIRFVVAESLDNEYHLKEFFDLK